jgi:hypothetical protein
MLCREILKSLDCASQNLDLVIFNEGKAIRLHVSFSFPLRQTGYARIVVKELYDVYSIGPLAGCRNRLLDKSPMPKPGHIHI